MRRKAASIAFDKEVLDEIDKYELTRSIYRSGLVRMAISEFLERAKSERKENKNETSETK